MAGAAHLLQDSRWNLRPRPPRTTNIFGNRTCGIQKKSAKGQMHCVASFDDWHLSTCYSRANRLKNFAVINKHAAIQGMPEISRKDVEIISKTVVTMKGNRNTRKCKKHWRNENYG